MKNCYLCNTELTNTNRSKEHIILNSIGGRLKSLGLLCKQCNSKLGEGSDKALYEQLSFFAGLLQVKRDKGDNQPIKGGKTKSGVEYILNDGCNPMLAKPNVKNQIIDGRLELNLTVRNKKELKGILTNIQKRYPNYKIDIEKIVNDAKEQETFLDEPITYKNIIGGADAFHSIAKTAINFYIDTMQEQTQVAHLFSYLKGDEQQQIVTHFYPSKPLYKKDKGEISHTIYLQGDTHSKTLYCYIEFFSLYSFLVKLSDNYNGNSIKKTYSYNLVTNNEIKRKIEVKFTPADFDSNRTMQPSDFSEIQEKADRFMRIADEKQRRNQIGNIVEKAFSRYAEGAILTEDMINEINNEISFELAKFICRLQGISNRGANRGLIK